MSGSKDIVIEQLRAEVERLRDDRADLQERCNRLTGERNAALLLMKDEEARAEKAERERDEWKARHDTLADVSRKCIATAEHERDEARAERDARPDISPEDAASFMRWYEGGAAWIAPLVSALRAHAAKVKVKF